MLKGLEGAQAAEIGVDELITHALRQKAEIVRRKLTAQEVAEVSISRDTDVSSHKVASRKAALTLAGSIARSAIGGSIDRVASSANIAKSGQGRDEAAEAYESKREELLSGRWL